jgi:hypothetical protein
LLLLRKQLGHTFCHHSAPHRSSVKIECAEPMLIPTSSAISRTVRRRSSRIRAHIFNDICIPACWWTPGTLVTLRECAAVFEALKPLFDLRSTHCIIAESLLNLPNCFHLGICKLLAKLVAVSLLHACSATSTYYSTSHTSCLGAKDALDEAAKNHSCTWRSPPTHHCDQICQPAVTGFSRNK